jgi:hypothetical protein
MSFSLMPAFAALRRHVAPRNTTSVVTAMCIVFGALLVLGIYRVRDTESGPTAPRFGVGAETASEYDLDANDPVARFAQTQIGHVLFAPRRGDQCQRVLFDNQTGAQYEAKSLDCSRPAAEVVASTDRLGALRKTFQK